MTRLVALALADRARLRGLAELATGRRRAGEARRLLEAIADELALRPGSAGDHPAEARRRQRAADPGACDATPPLQLARRLIV